MPGNVANAVVLTVLPQGVFSSFARSQEYAVEENGYQNGESQRRALTTTSRKRWRQVWPVTGTAAITLRAFYDARKGPAEAFYIYDPWEASPLFSHDPTGVATAGRYTVRFSGAWEQSMGLPRGEVSLELIEVS